MSKRFYFDEFSEDIFDDEIQQYPSNQTICNILNQQQERIAELEEQLQNAIVPKFKIGQEVWIIFDRTLFGERLRTVEKTEIFGINVTDFIDYYFQTLPCIAREEEIFATREEALAKLEKLKGE